MNSIRLSIFGGFFFLFQFLGLYAQEEAPNDIPIPWYSQKIKSYPYAHCSLAASLMVFDYYNGMTTDTQRDASEAEAKLIEYQQNYFLKKRAPFRRRTSIGQGGYYAFELDSLARHYERMISAEHFYNKDYKELKQYIDKGIPVLVNVSFRSSLTGLIPGSHRHWMVLRGMTDDHVWLNDPGRSPAMRNKGENRCYPIKKVKGNQSYFDGCWTGRYIVITPQEWIHPDYILTNNILIQEIPPMKKECETPGTPPDINYK